MRLLDISWLICLALSVATGPLKKCNQLDRLDLVDTLEICQCANEQLGNTQRHAVLDFSKTRNDTTFNDFLTRRDQNKGCFTSTQGTIVIVGNNQLKKINFTNIQKMEAAHLAEGDVLIDIRHNYNLEEIKWAFALSATPKHVAVFIYSNPMMEDKTMKSLQNIFPQADYDTQLQNTSGECEFVDRADGMISILPDEDYLSRCETIKGDLIVINSKITKNIRLSDYACLTLINTNMTGIQLTFNGSRGEAQCSDPLFSSAIENNPGLNRKDALALMEYFIDMEDIPFRLHSSHQKICKAEQEVLNKTAPCDAITFPADISAWFMGRDYAEHRLALEQATYLLIYNTSAEIIDLPNLQNVTMLTLQYNPKLTELYLATRVDIKRLSIIDCQLLQRVDYLSKVLKENPKLMKAKIWLVCFATPQTPIKEIGVLKVCRTIIGPLIIENIARPLIRDDVNILDVYNGCIRLNNLSNTDLDFLYWVSVHQKDCEITIQNMPHICPNEVNLYAMYAVRVEGEINKDCNVQCTQMDSINCKAYFGHLRIKYESHMENFYGLKEIEGSLIVEDTNLTVLDFPHLKRVKGMHAPVIRITGNHRLTRLNFPRLEEVTVTSDERPYVEVVDSDLSRKEVTNALQRAHFGCTVEDGDLCHYEPYVKVEKKKKEWGPRQWSLAIGSGLGIIGLIVSLYFNFKLFLNSDIDANDKWITAADVRLPLGIYRYRNPMSFKLTQEMAGYLVALLKGVLSKKFLIRRYKFYHGIRTPGSFTHKKMNFNRNVHYCCDDYLAKLPEFIQALEEKVLEMKESRQRGGKEAKKVASDDSAEAWINLNRIHLLQIGRGFLPMLFNSMHDKQNANVKANRIFYLDVLGSPVMDGLVSSTLVDIHFYNSSGKTMIAEVELTEIFIPYNFYAKMPQITRHKWFAWIYSAVKNNELILTDSPENFLMIYFVISTIDLMLGVYGPLDEKALATFGEGLHDTYLELYRGGERPSANLNGRDPWSIWLVYLLDFAEKLDPGQFQGGVAAQLKQWKHKKKARRQIKEIYAVYVRLRTVGDGVSVKHKEMLRVDGEQVQLVEQKARMQPPGDGMHYVTVLSKEEWENRQGPAGGYGRGRSRPATTPIRSMEGKTPVEISAKAKATTSTPTDKSPHSQDRLELRKQRPKKLLNKKDAQMIVRS